MLQHSVVMVALSTGVNFFNYLYQVVMGRMLAPEQYGELLSLVSLVAIVNAIAKVISPIVAKYISKFRAHEEHDKIRSYYSRSVWVTLGIGTVSFLVLSLLTPLLASYLKIESHLAFIVIFSSLIFGFAIPAGFGMLMGLQDFFKLGLVQLLWAFLKFVVSTALVYLSYGIVGGVAGVSVSNIITFLVLFLVLREYYRPSEKKPDLDELRAYARFTLIVTFFMAVLSQADVIFAKHYLSSEDAGLYASISVLGRIIFFSASGVGIVIFPKIAHAKEVGTDPRPIVAKGVALTLLIGGAILAAYHLYPAFIVSFIFGEKYMAAVPYITRYGLAMLFLSLLMLLSHVVLSFEMTSLAAPYALAVVAEVIAIAVHHGGIMEVIDALLVVSCVFVLIVGGGVWASLNKAIKRPAPNTT